jgi:hypothetical protein
MISSALVGCLGEERHTGHDHSGRAVTALESARFQEGFLKRMQSTALFEPFDCGDLLTSSRTHRGYAGPCGLAIYQNRAGAALALTTPIFCTGKIHIVSQNAEEAAIRLYLDPVSRGVDSKLDYFRHNTSGCYKLGESTERRFAFRVVRFAFSLHQDISEEREKPAT